MELGKRIKAHRAQAGLTQDELAQRVFVSRQTVSNWENDKSYPDIKSLLLMSEIFGTSLDSFIKGDLEKMKQPVDPQEYARFEKESAIFAVLLILIIVAPLPLIMLLDVWGIAICACLFIIGMAFALRIEKYKKKFDIQTYKEIVAFTEGKSLSEIEKAREEGKRPYQKVLAGVLSGLLVIAVALVITAVAKLLGWHI